MRTMMLFIVACLGASTVLAQGLGDAARKEQAKRQKSAESGAKTRVIDDDALHSATEGKGTLSVGSGADSAAAPNLDVPAEAGSAPSAGGGRAENAGARGGEPQSDYSKLQQKTASWRAKYRSAKAQVDALERQVAELEAKAQQPGGGAAVNTAPVRDANGKVLLLGRTKSEGDAARERLPQARQELARARQALSSVEDAARRDGVGSGQLY